MLLVAAWCALFLPGALYAGYLNTTGPVPLRFEKAIAPAVNARRLPPLPADNPPEQPPLPTPEDAQTGTERAKTNTAEAKPAHDATTPTLAITPQMLLEFFRPRPGEGQGEGSSVYLPFQFVPPIATLPPSSSATYSTPK